MSYRLTPGLSGSVQSAEALRRRIEAAIEPAPDVGAEPLRGHLVPQPFALTGVVDQLARGGELDAHARVALVVDDLVVGLPSGMESGDHLADLRDLVPAHAAVVDQVEQLTLLV